MTISVAYPYNLQNGTTADATQVMADFLQIQNDVNANAAHNGANSDITSLAGLTTPLSVGQGGTGATTASAARTALGLGAAAVENLGGEIIDDGAGNLTIASSAALAGSPTTTTQAGSDSSTKIATTAQVQAAIVASAKITRIKVTQFNAGVSTWTVDTTNAYSIVEMCAGGGGGAGSGSGTNNGSGSGGAAGYLKALLTAAQVGASQTVTVGALGAGGASGANNGSAGGASSVGSLLSCNGGAGATVGGGAGTTNLGGAGGSATVSTGTTLAAIIGQTGGYGGQSASSLCAAGANTPGGLGQGGGFIFVPQGSGTAIDGLSATGYGAGGSSGGTQTTTGAAAGGNGSPGIVIITEYCTQ